MERLGGLGWTGERVDNTAKGLSIREIALPPSFHPTPIQYVYGIEGVLNKKR